MPASKKRKLLPKPAPNESSNTMTLRVPSYYSAALHSLASRPPPIVVMKKLSQAEIETASHANLADHAHVTNHASPAHDTNHDQQINHSETKNIHEDAGAEPYPMRNRKKKKKKSKLSNALIPQNGEDAEEVEIEDSMTERKDDSNLLSDEGGQYIMHPTSLQYDLNSGQIFGENGHPSPIEYNDVQRPDYNEHTERGMRKKSFKEKRLVPYQDNQECSNCKTLSANLEQVKLDKLKVEKEMEKIRMEVEIYRKKDAENQTAMNTLRETQEYFLRRIKSLEEKKSTSVEEISSEPILTKSNGKRPTKRARSPDPDVILDEGSPAPEDVPIAASRPRRSQTHPWASLARPSQAETSRPRRTNVNSDNIKRNSVAKVNGDSVKQTATRSSTTPKPESKLSIPSTAYLERFVDEDQTGDSDFDPFASYESEEDPEASDDSDFNPAKKKKKQKKLKGKPASVKKKARQSDETPRPDNEAIGDGWDFEIRMNPDFLEEEGDGDESRLLEGQFEPRNEDEPNDVVASRSEEKRKKPNSKSTASSSSAPSKTPATAKTLSSSTKASQEHPRSQPQEWVGFLHELMNVAFDIGTRKHVRFEDLDTGKLQNIQGRVHEKFGVGFKDIFVSMRRKSSADNKKAKCTCSDCVFMAVEEASATW